MFMRHYVYQIITVRDRVRVRVRVRFIPALVRIPDRATEETPKSNPNP